MSQIPKSIEKPKKWHSLSEIPERPETPSAQTAGNTKNDTNNIAVAHEERHPLLSGVSDVLIKLLWDILVYPYSSVSVRIKRLGISARVYEQATFEGCEKGFIFKSAAGLTIYLIPENKPFLAFNMTDPFDSGDLREHSFYEHWCAFLNKKDPIYRAVQIKAKIGHSGAAADGTTTRHDGTHEAWEITLNTTNILANACKYKNTDFSKIIFLCRNYKLREAVKACCREGGLDPNLLAKIEYMHFSQLLQRQRKMSLY